MTAPPPKAQEAAWRFLLASAANNSVTLSCSVAQNPPFPQDYPKLVAELIADVDTADKERRLATDALAALTPQQAQPLQGYVSRWMGTAKSAVSCLHSIQTVGTRPKAPGAVDARFDDAQKRLTDGSFDTFRAAGAKFGDAFVESVTQDLEKALQDSSY